MSWSTKEKTFCVEAYFADKSYMVVQANFRRQFRRRNAPSKSRIFEWVKKFREHGIVQDLNSIGITDTYSSRRASTRTERNIDAVRNSVGRSPKKSLSRVFKACFRIRSSLVFLREPPSYEQSP